MRAGLDPQMVLAVMYHESGFKKYAFSSAQARGYMQVMPFWVKQIGSPDQNLFNLRTNLRYGTVILRHYLDIENGDYYRALGRYNGSLGTAEYPTACSPRSTGTSSIAAPGHGDQHGRRQRPR
jgi:soluble lytic murein transglycosylase-like protein